MKRNHSYLALPLLLAALLLLNSCKKESNSFDTVTANNQAFADETFNDANNIADEAATTGSVTYKTDEENSLLAGCATVTRDTVSSPRVATIDFGTGCTGADGRFRSGQIIVTHTGPYRQQGTVITITFNNYFVNGHQVLGTKTVTNNGRNNSGNLTFSVEAQGQIILADNAGTITWQSSRTREWIAGESTPTRDDDQYSVTGTASGTAANGDDFTATVVTPLVRNLAPSCRRHFVSGTVLLSRTGRQDRLIDFGSGACDNLATVTINGVTRTIQLRP